MDRSQALENVERILEERGANYGDLRENWQQTAKMIEMIVGVDIRPEQFGAIMIAMKLSRLSNADCQHLDSLLDIIGYAALTIEILGDVDEH
ncbi:MAG: DUF6378 domain-containing protein [Candidatus Puniceispirillaceae bacterium]